MGAFIIQNGEKLTIWICHLHMTLQSVHESCPKCLEELEFQYKVISNQILFQPKS